MHLPSTLYTLQVTQTPPFGPALADSAAAPIEIAVAAISKIDLMLICLVLVPCEDAGCVIIERECMGCVDFAQCWLSSRRCELVHTPDVLEIVRGA